jgi:hypothetical protein
MTVFWQSGGDFIGETPGWQAIRMKRAFPPKLRLDGAPGIVRIDAEREAGPSTLLEMTKRGAE